MKKGIVISHSDPAGQSMLPEIKKTLFPGVESNETKISRSGSIFLIEIEPFLVPPTPDDSWDPTYPAPLDGICTEYGIEKLVMLSRHWAASGSSAFTFHPTGNLGSADYGGNPGELQYVPAHQMRRTYLEVSKIPEGDYSVSLEVTHHSPSHFEIPLFFAELGSSEIQWNDKQAAKKLVKGVVASLLDEGIDDDLPVALGFGGGHYAPKFSKLALEEAAFGHMVAKYNIHLVTDQIIEEMIKKTVPTPTVAYVEKSLKGRHKKLIAKLLLERDIEVKRA